MNGRAPGDFVVARAVFICDGSAVRSQPLTPDRSPVEFHASAAVAAAYESARVAWPAVGLEWPVYAAAVSRVCAHAASPVSAAAIAHGDFYLATACAAQNPEALSVLDSICARVVREVAARMREHSITPEEVISLMRERLLVPRPDRPAGIAGYRGRGSLEGWLRVTAGRIVLEIRKRERRDLGQACPDRLESAAGGSDPELLYLKKLYSLEFKEAFARAVGQLSARDRNLLRYQVIHGLNIDKIAAIHGTHRATAARWLAKARAQLTEKTRDELASKLALEGTELDSVFRLIQSQLDVSLTRVLTR